MAISDAMAADLRALAEATADEDGVDLRASLNDLMPFGGCRGSRLPRAERSRWTTRRAESP